MGARLRAIVTARLRPIVAALLLLILLLYGCGNPAGDDSTVQVASRADVAPDPGDGAERPEPIDDCEALAAAADEDPHDAFALALLCPQVPLSPSQARATLMQAGTPTEIERVLARLPADSEAAGLARLLALESPATLPPTLDDPATAMVVPVDDHVIAQAALAHATYVSPTTTPEQRTRAQAYLAKVHLHAVLSLGLPERGPATPFARLLSARALHHGRSFCTAYWQERVVGLEALFAEVQAGLLDPLLALEASPHRADPALSATERERGRSYVLAARERIDTARTEHRVGGPARASTAALQPFPDELDRLLDHGFVDLAITRALRRGAEPDGYGLAAATRLVTTELERRELDEYTDKLRARLSDVRRAQPIPSEIGPRPLEARRAPGLAVADDVARRAREWLLAAAPAHGLGRRHALLRAVVLLRDEPAATLSLLRAVADDPALLPFAGLLTALAGAHDADTLAEARGLASATQRWRAVGRDAQESRRRRQISLAVREAGHSPR